jgi:hypothetical protein
MVELHDEYDDEEEEAVAWVLGLGILGFRR